MISINSDIGSAMAEAVVRSKRQPSPQQNAAALEKALHLIEILKEKNRRLEAQLAVRAARAGGVTPGAEQPEGQMWTGETVDGRPVVTIAQAARTCRISYQSAYRRIAAGKWDAAQLGSRDWRVFVDADGCPLMKSSQ